MKTSVLLALWGFALSVQQVNGGIVAGPITNAANGHFYYVISPTTWLQSEAEAVTLGGHLVTINDAAENAWLASTFSAYPVLAIGITDQVTEGEFRWISGDTATFRNWGGGEPNDNGGAEDYGFMHLDCGGCWNDNRGDFNAHGIVEVVPPNAPRCISAPSGLVAWWPGDGSAEDLSGQHSGTLSNGVGFAAAVAGQGFLLDGIDDEIALGSWFTIQEFTIQFWVNPAGNQTDAANIIDNNHSGGARNWCIEYANSPGRYYWYDPKVDRMEFTLAEGVWQHLAVTRTSNGLTKIIVNSAEVAARMATGPIPYENPTLRIGRWDVGGRYWRGLIDELAIHDHALSSNEVAIIYAAGSAGMCKPQCVTPPSGLVGWWPGDGDATDIFGGNNGTLQNGAMFAPGKVSQAFSFDGTNDFVQIAQNAFDGMTNVTVDVWVNFHSLDGPDQTIISALKSGTAHYFTLMRGTDGKVYLALESAAGFGCELAVPYPFQLDQWYHLAATKSAGLLAVYVNGAQIASQLTACTGPIPANLGTTLIGGQDPIGAGTVGRPMNGMIDEVEIFNRALSSNEIASIYAAGSTGKCKPTCVPPPSGLVSWWQGEGSALDSFGANNGMLKNGASFAPGLIGQAFSFDGVDDYVDVTNASYPQGNVPITIEFWMKGVPGGASNDRAVMIGTGVKDQAIMIGEVPPNRIAVFAAASTTCTSSSTVFDNAFHHIAGVYDLSALKLYVDGALENTSPYFALELTGNRILIGQQDIIVNDTYFKGLIDEVSIYSRALSSNEIAAIYAAGRAGMCKPQCTTPPPGLVLWWDFADGAATDRSGFQSDGVVHGSPLFTNGTVRFDNPVGDGGQWIDLPYPPSISALETNSFTIAIRYQCTDTLQRNGRLFGNYTRVVVNYSDGATTCAYAQINDGVQHINVPSSVYTNCTQVGRTIDGAYHWQIVCVDRANRLVSQYIDSRMVGSAAFANLGRIDLSGLVLGATKASDSYAARQTTVDELCIFNRALSFNEIAAIVAAGSAGMCKPEQVCVQPATGLVGWWPGDGNALDVVGGNNGALSNNVTFANGTVGHAFQFDGVDGYLRVPDAPALRVQQHTIAAWVRVDANTGTHQCIVCRPFGTGVSNSFALFVHQDGKIYGDVVTTSGEVSLPGFSVPFGAFFHAAQTWDGNVLRVFLNGALVATSLAQPGTVPYDGNDIFAGIDFDSGSFRFPLRGLLDEFQIFNRALSSNEIAAIYTAGSAGMCKPTVPPSIFQQPSNLTVFVTAPAVFRVQAAGDLPLRYQWRFNGNLLNGETNNVLTFAATQPSLAGGYDAIVSNPLGSVTSVVAILTVRIDIPDLAVTRVEVPATASVGQSIPLVFVITNQGSAAAQGPWSNIVFLATEGGGAQQTLGTFQFNGFFAPATAITITQAFVLSSGPIGSRFAGLTVDSANQIFETNRLNNTLIASLPIQIDAADLVVTNLTSLPASIKSGDEVTITWSDLNTGPGQTIASWHDQLVVSNVTANQRLIVTNVFFDSALRGRIPGGASKTNTARLRLPDGFPGVGTLQFIVTVDINNAVIEYNPGGTAESNNSASTNRNSTLASYPDLLVTDIITPAVGLPGQPIQIMWTVTNQGAADAVGVRTDVVSLSTDPLIGGDQVFQGFDLGRTIPMGQSIVVTQNVILPAGLIGDRYFVVTVNSGNLIFELVTTNNTAIATQRMTTLNADLAVQSVVAPGSAQLGQSINVTWSVQNVGGAAASVNWSDRLYLSTSSNSLNGADVLSTQPAVRPLAAGTSYTNSQSVLLPFNGSRLPGSYFLVVATDSGGVQQESNEANNLGSQAITLAYPPLPDLTVGNITIPPMALPGQIVPVSWTVTNRGSAVASGPWMESLYLSSDSVVGSDHFLTSTAAMINIPAGGFLTRTQQVTVPTTGASGDLFLLVLVDVQNSVIEESETNNFAFSTNSMNVPSVLTLSISAAQIAENAANPNVPASVSRNGDLTSALAVTVQSSDIHELTAPNTVTIPAGQASVAFNLTVQPDGIVDSNKLVTVTASAAGFIGSTGVVTVINTDLPHLSLSADTPTVTEGFTAPMTITRDTVTAQSLTVTLASSSPGNLLVPGFVTIPAFSNSLTFAVLAVDDTVVEQTRTFTVTASAGGYANASAAVTVLDNDLPFITLELASTNVSEGAGPAATTGTIRRTNAAAQVYVSLHSSDTSAAQVPPTLGLAPGQLETSFPIGAVDDLQTNAPKTTIISAFVLDSVSAQPLGSPVSRTLTVTDDDGPTLTLSVLRKVVAEGLYPATTGTVRRNTSTNTALIVNLASSDTNEATVPATVTIPIGQTAASLDITTIDDGVTDGSKPVVITASAPTFTSGNDTLLVTDTDLPDLAVASITVPAVVDTEAPYSITYRVSNQGLATVSSNFVTLIYLGTDPVGGKGTPIGQYTNQTALAAGASFDQTLQLLAPLSAGNYWVTVDTDTRNDVSEVFENNNFRISATPISVQPAYRAIVQTDTQSAVPGTPILLWGQALRRGSDDPMPGVLVFLHILVAGTDRIIQVQTDTNGNFSTTFAPLPGEAGAFTVIAMHPGQPSPADNGSGNTTAFSLLGMRLEIPNAYQSLVEHEPWTGRFNVRNLSAVPLTGLQAEVTGKPDNVTASVAFENGDGLLGNSVKTLALQLVAENSTNDIGEVGLRVTCVQGVVAEGRVLVSITRQRAQLAASVSSIEASMVRGRNRTVNFKISNPGAAATGPISLLLPPIPWFTSPAGQVLPSLASGESMDVTLSLAPGADVDLTVFNGSLALNCGTASLSLPFSFRCVSDATADLAVSAVDEFYYFGADNPKLSNAVVRLLDPFTSTQLVHGITGSNGVVSFSGLAEGPYTLEVSANDHLTYRNTVRLEAGVTNQELAFLSRQVVTYVWTVEPVEIEERVTISVTATFETFVPRPVIVVTPTVVDLSSLTRPGQTMQVDVKMANHGLIAWRGVNIGFEDNSLYELKPLITDVGIIPAQSETIVPVIARYKGTTPLAPAAKKGRPKAAGDPCNLYGWVTGYYPCGPNQVNDATSLQGYWYCAPSPNPPPPPPQTNAPPRPPRQDYTNSSVAGYSSIQLVTEEKCCSASISGPSGGNAGDIVSLSGYGGPPGGSFSWSVDSGATIVSGQSSSQVQVRLPNAPGTVNVNLTYTPSGAPRACGSSHRITIGCPQITFSPDQLTVSIGSTARSTVSVTPASAQGLVTFESADPSVASVAGSTPTITLTGVAVGSTTIRAKINNTECSAELMVNVVGTSLAFASAETGNQFFPAFGNGDAIASDSDFRFLVGENRQITVRYLDGSGVANTLTCEVQGLGSSPVPPDNSSPPLVNGTFTFTPLATTGNRPLTTTAIPAVAYSITIRDSSDNILTNTTISQDLKDRMRQEYVDAAIWNDLVINPQNGAKFLYGSVGLVSHAPPRGQVNVAQSSDVGGPGPIGSCRASPSPNYFDPASGNGLIWNQGFVGLVQTLRAQMSPEFVCLHSGHRSPSHNRRFGGVVNSDHQWGKAADISYTGSFSATLANASFHLRLYRAALNATFGQVLLENNAHQRLPNRWNPPPGNYTFQSVNGNPTWSVTVEDYNGDGLADRVSQVTGQIPWSTPLDWNGGGGNPQFGVIDNDGDGLISVGDTLILNYDGANTLYERFSGATHVHAAAN